MGNITNSTFRRWWFVQIIVECGVINGRERKLGLSATVAFSRYLLKRGQGHSLVQLSTHTFRIYTVSEFIVYS